MKKFILFILLFTSIGITINGTIILLSKNIETNRIKEYKNKLNAETIIIGDSQVRFAIVDTLLRSSINMGNNSETLFLSYYKIKTLLKDNKITKNIILGMGYHTFSTMYDAGYNGIQSIDVLPNYVNIIPINDIINLFENKPRYALHNFVEINEKSIRKVIQPGENLNFIGGYHNSSETKTANKDVIEKRVKHHFYEKNQKRKISNNQVDYFEKIIKICNEYNVKLIIMRLPINLMYLNKVPMEFINFYKGIINKYNLSLIDFEGITLENNDFLPDGDHVNQKGALMVTNFLKSKNF